MECTYCVVIIMICLNVFFYFLWMNFKVSFWLFHQGYVCVVALVLAAITRRRATFQPLVIMLLMSGWYLMVFLAKVLSANLLL